MMENYRQCWILQEKVLGKRGFLNRILRKSLIAKAGAGNENRTRIASLEGWSFTIKLCPQSIEREQGCHGVAGSQGVFPGQKLKRDRGGWFSPGVAGVPSQSNLLFVAIKMARRLCKRSVPLCWILKKPSEHASLTSRPEKGRLTWGEIHGISGPVQH
jgi:hypothetical protein